MQVHNEMLLSVLYKKLQKSEVLLVNISGSSMYPTFQHGDKVKIFIYNFDDLKIGDIIAYKKFNRHLTVHRIDEMLKHHKLSHLGNLALIDLTNENNANSIKQVIN